MKIVAEKIVLELSENDIKKCRTIYEVRDGETVESLMSRVGITGGNISWHYDQVEIRLKLVKETR